MTVNNLWIGAVQNGGRWIGAVQPAATVAGVPALRSSSFDFTPVADATPWQRRPLLTISGAGPVVNSPLPIQAGQRFDPLPENYWQWYQQQFFNRQIIENMPDAPGDLLQQRVFVVITDG